MLPFSWLWIWWWWCRCTGVNVCGCCWLPLSSQGPKVAPSPQRMTSPSPTLLLLLLLLFSFLYFNNPKRSILTRRCRKHDTCLRQPLTGWMRVNNWWFSCCSTVWINFRANFPGLHKTRLGAAPNDKISVWYPGTLGDFFSLYWQVDFPRTLCSFWDNFNELFLLVKFFFFRTLDFFSSLDKGQRLCRYHQLFPLCQTGTILINIINSH